MTHKQIENRLKKMDSLKTQLDVIKDEIESIKDEIRYGLDGADEVITDRWTIREKVISRKNIDSQRLKNELPDLYSKYSKVTSYLRFEYKLHI